MLSDTNSASNIPFDNDAARPLGSRVRLATDRCVVFGGNSYEQTDRNSAARPNDDVAVETPRPVVTISPPDMVKRRTVAWPGMVAEFVLSMSRARIDCSFHAPMHLLVVCELGTRRDGETFIEGLPRSTLRDFTGKLAFVPAGNKYHEWQQPRTHTSLMYFYIDPAKLRAHTGLDLADSSFAPRLFFEDTTLWNTALKLKRSVEGLTSENPLYAEALGVVLLHELARVSRGASPICQQVRGGLAAWQQRVVAAHIDEHLAEQIPLAALAELARLSPYHFCRAFKQSFGLPPHRYHTKRRIEHAKVLLTKPLLSVTDIGLTVGFSETSSFTAAFRKVVGLTPTGYRRNLE
jgi:AraC family transcriptional regulator